MKFVDNAVIKVSAGKGGDGCLSFRREKYIPYGGPDGGDGGDGGSIYLIGDEGLNTLSEFRYKNYFSAKSGEAGRGKNKRGKSADNLYIKIPVGTKVFDNSTNEEIGEVLSNNQQILVARGGYHGIGNTRFKSSVNRTPSQTTKGKVGDKREIKLELQVMADVAMLGMPNAGKSSLIRQITKSRPKVADYPFTTIYPSLGVVNVDELSFVIADVPGLLENAADGVGLGNEFLRHLSRAKILAHILDIAPVDGTNPANNYLIIENELKKYSTFLHNKPRLLVINKIDLMPTKKIIKSVIKDTKYQGEVLLISALTGEGCQQLIYKLSEFINANLDC